MAGLMTDIEGLITRDIDNWNGIENIIVSSRFNHQDGWWVRNESDKWVENDKPVDQRCSASSECNPDMCCANYPDSNNTRCIARSDNRKVLTVGPVSFIPSCPDVLAVDVVPQNAEDDISKDALAEATNKLENFYFSQKSDAKLNADYDSLG